MGAKSVARILGILGGIAMFLTASFGTLGAGLDPPVLSESELDMVFRWGLATVSLSILGIVGGALARRTSKAPGILMLISGIGGMIAILRGFAFGPCFSGATPCTISVGVFGLCGVQDILYSF